MNYGNDIGYLGNNPGSISISNNAPVKHTQVYYATHRDNGARSSFMNRSFISFSFGGKWIEDFNLIACINGDRLNKQLHANFNDLVSEYEVVNGQFYWGTYYTNNQISFTLATDGITQNQLDEFKNWFAPGQVRELVLSEHPNRAIMARVSEPPIMDIIPFEEETTVMVNATEYKTSTTVYKGEFTLNLVMDEPFWHSKSNLLAIIDSPANLITLIKRNGIITKDDVSNGYRNITYTSNIDNSSRTIIFPYNSGQTQMWADIWSDANDNIVPILEDKDALKVILEDGIPTLSMLKDPMFLGNGLVFDFIEQNARVGYAIVGKAVLGNTDQVIQKTGNSITIPQNGSAYLYYAGTAPELPIINMKLSLHTGNTKNNFIEFLSDSSQKLIFNLPIIYFDWYSAISLLFDGDINSLYLKTNIDIDLVRKKGNDQLTHPIIRKMFFTILDYYKLKISGYNQAQFVLNVFKKIFSAPNLAEYNFNFQTGEMIGTLPVYQIPDNLPKKNSFNDLVSSMELVTLKEDVSDMIISKPIILDKKNYPDEKGTIQYWTKTNPNYSYKISHNMDGDVTLSITYQNKYY